MKGYTSDPDDLTNEGRLDEQKNFRELQNQLFGRISCFQPFQ